MPISMVMASSPASGAADRHANGMIRPANPDDEGAIRACAETVYARYVAAIGRKPAPMVADFKARIAAGQVHVAAGP